MTQSRTRRISMLAGASAMMLGVWAGQTVSPPAPAAASPSPAFTVIPAGAFAIVPGRSSVTFAVPDNRGGFTGHTAQVSGQVNIERGAGQAYTARITGSVDARSLTTDNGVRDRAMHATSLQTAKYPTIAFTGTATASPGFSVHPFPAAIHGRLTIKDVTREVAFTGTVVALANQYVADATATVRMADYGIPYPRAFIFVARDPVTVTLHIVARSPQAGRTIRPSGAPIDTLQRRPRHAAYSGAAASAANRLHTRFSGCAPSSPLARLRTATVFWASSGSATTV